MHQVCQWVSASRCLATGTPVFSTNKTYRNWSIVESGVKHHYLNPNPFIYQTSYSNKNALLSYKSVYFYYWLIGNIYNIRLKIKPNTVRISLLDLWADNFLFFHRRDLNSRRWYTTAPIAFSLMSSALDHSVTSSITYSFNSRSGTLSCKGNLSLSRDRSIYISVI